MRICVDLDGVVCRLREPDQTYAEVEPMPGAVEKLRALRAAGHYVILYTARHMKTCAGNIGQVVARQGATTLDWLKQHGIEFDEFHFGKPHADVYIDDNAVRFETWDEIAADGSSLPQSTERNLARQITDQITECVADRVADELSRQIVDKRREPGGEQNRSPPPELQR